MKAMMRATVETPWASRVDVEVEAVLNSDDTRLVAAVMFEHLRLIVEEVDNEKARLHRDGADDERTTLRQRVERARAETDGRPPPVPA